MISSRAVPVAFRCWLFCGVPLGMIAQQAPVSSNDLRASARSVPSIAVPPRPALTPEHRGHIYIARQMYRDAIDMYRQGPDSPALANKIGIAFHQLLDFSLAKKNYERAMKLNPKFPEAINNLGTIYYEQKNYKRAINCYKRALKYSPQAASIYVNVGAAYFART